MEINSFTWCAEILEGVHANPCVREEGRLWAPVNARVNWSVVVWMLACVSSPSLSRMLSHSLWEISWASLSHLQLLHVFLEPNSIGNINSFIFTWIWGQSKRWIIESVNSVLVTLVNVTGRWVRRALADWRLCSRVRGRVRRRIWFQAKGQDGYQTQGRLDRGAWTQSVHLHHPQKRLKVRLT